MTTGWHKYGVQLAVHSALAAAFAGLVSWLLAMRIWPAAAIWAVPTLGLMTRVAVLIRLRRMGWYAADESDRPSSAVVNREMSKVFLVQLVGWLMVAAYSAATGVWLGLGVSLALAYISLAVVRLLRRSARRPGQTHGSEGR
ncbi:hypothetical protein EV651_10484 [Kribbella sp. VKM Ac-2571]|uniref:hypothetical protein n=1 Tax=Kribbella sp. VKM Ac-2571 TaxID=2512222 RepID=UPI00105E0460|nr:hypothetical protein [Kribbella sp. VKM Ac-2571]TDO66519.1 hypothetical protein EV651_10484 [Kribbella sp. VKM Ac-2571]